VEQRWAGPYGTDWRGLQAFNQVEARIARTQLRWLRITAVLAGLLLIFAVAATWLAPTTTKTVPATILVVRQDGSFACGDLAKSGEPGKVAVVEAKGKPATKIEASKVLSITTAAHCP